jgi:hypothetical protein
MTTCHSTQEGERRNPWWRDPTYRTIPQGTTEGEVNLNHMHIVLAIVAALAVVGNEPPVAPVMKTFPSLSTARALTVSAVGPPKQVPNTSLPEALSFPT